MFWNVKMKTCNGTNLFFTWFAVIGVCLTLLASVTWLALALVATHSVMANSTIATWALHTLIDINLTCLTLRQKIVKGRLITLSSGKVGMTRWNRNEWMDTLPSFRADAREALVVFRLLTYSTIFTGSGAAGRQQSLTVFTWWQRIENISVCIERAIWSNCFRVQNQTSSHKINITFPYVSRLLIKISFLRVT